MFPFLLPFLGAAGAAAPAATGALAAGIGSTLGAGALTPAIASAALPAAAGAATAAPAAAVAAPAAAGGIGALGSTLPGGLGIAGGAITPAVAGVAPAATGAAAKGAGILGGLSMDKMILPAMMMGQFMGGGGGKKEKSNPNAGKEQYTGGDPVFPGEDYRPGTDDEWNYFPRTRFAKRGGLIGYAQGGIAQLDPAAQMPPGQMPAPGQMPQPGMPAPAGIAGAVPNPFLEQAMQANMPMAAQEGGVSPEEPSDDQIIEEAVMALTGQHPDPDSAIGNFVKTFGETALQDLAMRVKGQGGGDGMSDTIPASIEGEQPAMLSEGEFIVPADVVSGLGNGSTQAGAQQLDGMMNRVRTMRGGGPVQPPAINARGIMPV